MTEIKRINRDILRKGRSFVLSIGIHALFFVIGSLLLTFVNNAEPSSGYVEVTAIRGIPSQMTSKEKTAKDESLTAETPEKPESNESSASDKKADNERDAASGYMDMRTSGFDSTSLNQVYREKTLNLNIKYPVGWVFLDQQVRKKIDGITFWAAQGVYDPPPYIHVEVLDKYLFNESKYKHRYEFRDFTGYYNDPVEIDDQVTQLVYIRTEDDEDFSIKLIMKGREQFKAFQPVFFAMIKSFRFGNSIF